MLTGDQIEAPTTIRSIGTFRPLFGAFRPIVNPILPRVVGSRALVFDEPGEYYLRIDDRPLKVLVFRRGDEVSSAVLQLFHFCVANNLYVGIEDNAWYKYRERFLDGFFTSANPMMLSCGPTHSMFRVLVADRLGLPTRIVNLSSVFYAGDTLGKATHNVPEVYLPDIGKFVLLDLNTGYVARWLDAFGLTEAIRAKWSSTVRATDDWTSVGLDLVRDVHPLSPTASVEALVATQTADVHEPFSASMVSADPIDVTAMLRIFLSGPMYWGNNLGYFQPTGTEFLTGDAQLALYETDEVLRKALLDWQQSFKITVEVIDPEVMRRRLAAGAETVIKESEWAQRFPPA